MKKSIYFISIVFLVTFSSPAYSSTIYKWVDQQGVMNFTDDPNNVPRSYRSRVEAEVVEEAALSQVRYGSRTQVKIRILQLDRTNSKRMKYEEKVTEANQMLRKLEKEAEESKANLEWLK